MKVLGIGAHPDDIEIFMYGLLSIYKKEGHQVYTMIATDGAKGGAIKGRKLVKQRFFPFRWNAGTLWHVRQLDCFAYEAL